MNNRTFLPAPAKIQRAWHVVDASNAVLGRLAVRVATVLRGKNKPIYTNHLDCGDFVIVTNASKVVLTGKKLDQKIAFRHSGYPGGDKYTVYRKLMAEQPEKAVMLAVKGMLPKNKLAARQMRRLRVYRAAEHPHAAQIAPAAAAAAQK